MTESSTIDRKRILGLVLAGGLSRRMGGGDKSLAALGGRTMLAHVLARLGPQVGALVLNANGDPARFAAYALPVVADTVGGFVGPLAGVLAGMRFAATRTPGATHIASVSADAPFLPADLVARLAAAVAGRPRAIALARSAGELHPVIGLWPVALADDLESALAAGVRKVLAWTDRHGTVAVDFEMLQAGAETVDPFFNANTPAELDEARRLLAVLAPRLAVQTGPHRLQEGPASEPSSQPQPPDTRPTGGQRGPVIGIAGWKNSGKTTLAERLVAEMTRRGYRVATVKHAHHGFQIDESDADSARHRRAGASQVAIVSPERLALIRELGRAPEPDLADVVALLAPTDLVIVEGYKSAPIPKIETRRTQALRQDPLAPADPHVIAIAADHVTEAHGRPVYGLGDIAGLADLIERRLGLVRRG